MTQNARPTIRLFNLEVRFKPSFVPGFLLLSLVLTVLAGLFTPMLWGTALIAGVLAAGIHVISEFFHHLGHAFAARRVGYPMKGVTFLWVLAASVYPSDEPELPAETHIQRALGGPMWSILLTLIAGVLFIFVSGTQGLAYWLVFWLFWDNLLTFSLGAFLPLGFTDGSTLLEWFPKLGEKHE